MISALMFGYLMFGCLVGIVLAGYAGAHLDRVSTDRLVRGAATLAAVISTGIMIFLWPILVCGVVAGAAEGCRERRKNARSSRALLDALRRNHGSGRP